MGNQGKGQDRGEGNHGKGEVKRKGDGKSWRERVKWRENEESWKGRGLRGGEMGKHGKTNGQWERQLEIMGEEWNGSGGIWKNIEEGDE